MEPIKIKFNKKRIALLLIICIPCYILFWNFFLNPEDHITSRHKSPFIICIIGFLGVLFLSIGIFVLLKMFVRKNPALIIDEKGITDYTTFVSIGLILWEDITAIKGRKVKSDYLITIHVKNKKKYLALSKNRFQTYMMKLNSKYFRSPIHINSSGLQCKHDELMAIILKAYETHK